MSDETQRLRDHCNKLIRSINCGGGLQTPGFVTINALLKKCDAVFAANDAKQARIEALEAENAKLRAERDGIEAQAYERAAEVCDHAAGEWADEDYVYARNAAMHCAATIRQLKGHHND